MVMRKYILLVLIILLCGCTKEVSDNIETEKVVKDDSIIWILSDQIKGLEKLDTTYDLYKKGRGTIDNYTNDDKILYGINEAIIKDNAEDYKYVYINVIKNYLKKMFGPNNISFHTIDNYIFDNDKYIINYENNNKSIVSYIDKVTVKYNYYYVTVYAGIIDNDEVYGDFDETKLVQVLYNDMQYDIDKKDYKSFTKYKYKFMKNYEGNYILVEFNKI